MHDIRAIRSNPQAFATAMSRRGHLSVVEGLLELDASRRNAATELQERQARRNAVARQIGEARRKGEDSTALEAEGSALRIEMEALQERSEHDEGALKAALEGLPNVLDADVPDGDDETANVVMHQHGEIPCFDFVPRQHFEIGEAMGGMDFAMAAKLAGSRFTLLRGPLARLERALGQWMLDLHVQEHGYTEVSVPLLVNGESMRGTGQLPKFEDDLFRTTDGRWMIPTAEVPLTNVVRDEILNEADLPVRMASLSPCFRAEAGAAGRDARGLIRQHQFNKVELVSIVSPEESDAEHERMTRCAERVLTELGLTWRRVMLCSGDTGFSAARTYDLEVWLPGQAAWREISSCSNTRDFQARRMASRFRREGANLLTHTLNGSGVAVGRALIAVMETHQRADGSIAVPPVLQGRLQV